MGAARVRKANDPDYGKKSKVTLSAEAGRLRVIEIVKNLGLVKVRCACGTCNNIGYALKDACKCCVVEIYKELKAALLAEGFVHNAQAIDDVFESYNSDRPLLFVPEPEALEAASA